jgi:hypothetical protein
LLFRAQYRKIIHMRIREKLGLIGAGTAVILMVVTAPVFAQSTSSHYRVDESFFGSGGELDSSSASYKARQSAGELAVGNAASAHYQFYGGFNTTDQPLLEFAVSGGTYDLGTIDPTTTGAVQATFTVRNYLSSGYVVILNGTTPSSSNGPGHTLSNLTSPTSSTPGTEQFGVNLATNTNPPIGSAPSQSPDSSFGSGAAMNNYATANLFKFVDGDTIAFSNKSSGTTNYTLSIIANVARATAAGQYGGALNLQVVPTF